MTNVITASLCLPCYKGTLRVRYVSNSGEMIIAGTRVVTLAKVRCGYRLKMEPTGISGRLTAEYMREREKSSMTPRSLA